jgi:hypothetical protein
MPSEYEYDVVISYAGEDKVTVDRIERLLRQKVPSIRIFYAPLKEADLWGKDLAEELPTVFREEGRYCVMFISEHYAQKLWPTVERKAAIQRAVQQQEEYILPVRIDNTQLPGLSPTIAYYDMREKSPKDVVDGIKHKLGIQDSPEPTLLPKLSRSQRLQLFDDRMCEAFAGARGLVLIEDPADIKRCLDIVLKPPLVTGALPNTGWIWWWRGNMHNMITTYSYMPKEQVYLIDEWELNVKLLAGYRVASRDLQYVYVESDPLKSSGVRCWANQDIDDMINTLGVAYEDIAIFEGHYISRPEYDDGFANINEQVVNVMERSEPRLRPLTRFNLLIAPKETRLNNPDFDDKLEAICNQILAGQASLDKLVGAINQIRWGLSLPPNWIE